MVVDPAAPGCGGGSGLTRARSELTGPMQEEWGARPRGKPGRTETAPRVTAGTPSRAAARERAVSDTRSGRAPALEFGIRSPLLKSHFGSKVFDTVIPRNVRLAEAPSYGLPGVVFDPASKGAQAFVAFAAEMVERSRSM